MNTTPSAKAFDSDLAPNVDPKWAEAFIVELRLQGVSGETLGAGLAEVDSHCAESGEPVATAFGDPHQYARSLELPADGVGLGPGAAVRRLVPVVVQIIGFMAMMRAAPAIRSEGGVSVTVGDLASWAIVAAAILSLIWFTPQLIRSISTRPVLTIAAAAVFFALMVVPLFLWQEPLVDVSVLGVILVGAVCLAVGTVWEIRRVRAGADADEISRPLEDPAALQRRRRFTRWMEYFRIFTFPVIGFGLVTVILILS